MPYGVQIFGINGLVSIDEVKIPLVVQKNTITATATSGSFAVPSDITGANAFFVVDYPDATISISGNTVSWSGVSIGQTFTITVLEF